MGKNALCVAAKGIVPHGGFQSTFVAAYVMRFIGLADGWQQSWFLAARKVCAHDDDCPGGTLMHMG